MSRRGNHYDNAVAESFFRTLKVELITGDGFGRERRPRQRLSSDECRISKADLLDTAGRKVVDLHAGPNDVRHLSSGIYFVPSEPAAVQRVVTFR